MHWIENAIYVALWGLGILMVILLVAGIYDAICGPDRGLCLGLERSGKYYRCVQWEFPEGK